MKLRKSLLLYRGNIDLKSLKKNNDRKKIKQFGGLFLSNNHHFQIGGAFMNLKTFIVAILFVVLFIPLQLSDPSIINLDKTEYIRSYDINKDQLLNDFLNNQTSIDVTNRSITYGCDSEGRCSDNTLTRSSYRRIFANLDLQGGYSTNLVKTLKTPGGSSQHPGGLPKISGTIGYNMAAEIQDHRLVNFYNLTKSQNVGDRFVNFPAGSKKLFQLIESSIMEQYHLMQKMDMTNSSDFWVEISLTRLGALPLIGNILGKAWHFDGCSYLEPTGGNTSIYNMDTISTRYSDLSHEISTPNHGVITMTYAPDAHTTAPYQLLKTDDTTLDLPDSRPGTTTFLNQDPKSGSVVKHAARWTAGQDRNVLLMMFMSKRDDIRVIKNSLEKISGYL